MTTETKFTPGPWMIHPKGEEMPLVREAKYGFDVATVADGYVDFNGPAHVLVEWHPDVVQANANLIAAAPELYAALYRIRHGHNNQEAHDMAEAALVKARGEVQA